MDISQLSKQLSPLPKRFPDCCLAISTSLIVYLASLLPKNPGFTVSIGSGSGLLESLIAYGDDNTSVEGVEVNSTVNRYIAEEHMHVVGGAWGLYPGIEKAAAWMFVYPRDPKLITKYIDTYGDCAVEFIVWLGPKIDWADFEPCFRDSTFSELSCPENIGLTPYEKMVLAKRSS
ncbi:hypothetical protein N7462_010328 [Penicillium macrosclerotiorum]|uniref:uncharacterized protein n=1 Tax=Penicillium macrosclerotiorum TaxID=303699 RepID=UPI0025469355|nr:uncharacterized protein N7462_010328 [Penicillium macrosclerotiorum]KAJ5669258.1 hypothetical protein N7462_010328 [Penicillium macrosclerotiorum]